MSPAERTEMILSSLKQAELHLDALANDLWFSVDRKDPRALF